MHAVEALLLSHEILVLQPNSYTRQRCCIMGYHDVTRKVLFRTVTQQVGIRIGIKTAINDKREIS